MIFVNRSQHTVAIFRSPSSDRRRAPVFVVVPSSRVRTQGAGFSWKASQCSSATDDRRPYRKIADSWRLVEPRICKMQTNTTFPNRSVFSSRESLGASWNLRRLPNFRLQVLKRGAREQTKRKEAILPFRSILLAKNLFWLPSIEIFILLSWPVFTAEHTDEIRILNRTI